MHSLTVKMKLLRQNIMPLAVVFSLPIRYHDTSSVYTERKYSRQGFLSENTLSDINTNSEYNIILHCD